MNALVDLSSELMAREIRNLTLLWSLDNVPE